MVGLEDALVLDAARVDLQRTLAGDGPAPVEQGLGHEGQVGAAGLDQASAVVQDLGYREGHGAGAELGQTPALVGEVAGGQPQGTGREAALVVIQLGRGQGELGGAEVALGIAQGGRANVHGLARGQGPVAVVPRAVGGGLQVPARHQGASVDDAGGVEGRVALTADHASWIACGREAGSVLEPGGDGDRQCVAVQCENPAGVVGQVHAGQPQSPACPDKALHVAEVSLGLDRHGPQGGQGPRPVVQGAGRQVYVLGADAALIVDQGAGGGGAEGAAGLKAGAAMIHLPLSGGQGCVAPCVRAGSRQVQAAAVEGEVAPGGVGAHGPELTLGGEGELARGQHLTVFPEPGGQGTRGVETVRAQGEVGAAGQQAPVLDPFGAFQGDRSLGIHRAAVVEPSLGLDREVRAGRGPAGMDDVPLAGAGEVTRLGGQGAPVVDTHPRLRADEMDPLGVHPAELGHIDAHGGRAGVPLDHLDSQAGVAHLIGPHDDVQLTPCPDLAVDLEAARDQIDLVEVAGVQSLFPDLDFTGPDHESPETAVRPQDGDAGGEHPAVGVDEAAAIADDPVGIGNDHVGPGSGHLGVAREQAGLGAHHLVQNDLGTASGQEGVAGHVPALLGQHGVLGVVEDQPLGTDVELGVMVVGKTCGVGGGDLDQGPAVGRDVDHRPLRTGRAGRSRDLAMEGRDDAHAADQHRDAAGVAGRSFGHRRFPYHDPLGFVFIVEDTKTVLVHGQSVEAGLGSSKAEAGAETQDQALVGEVGGLVQGAAQEEVEGSAPAQGALQPEDGAAQRVARENRVVCTIDAPHVHPEIQGWAPLAQGAGHFIAEKAAAFRAEGLFAVEAPHRPAIPDGQVFHPIEVIPGVLPAQGPRIAKAVACEAEGHGKGGLQGIELVEEGGGGGAGAVPIGQGPEPGHPAPMGRSQVQLGTPQVLQVGQGHFDEAGVLVLDVELSVVEEGAALALAGAELDRILAGLVPIEKVTHPEIQILGAPLGDERLVAHDALGVSVGVPGGSEGPVTHGNGIKEIGPPGSAALAVGGEVMAQARAEQIRDPQGIVPGGVEVPLPFSGGPGPGIIPAQDELPGSAAPEGEDDLASAEVDAREDRDLHILAGHPLHLLQALFQIPEVQEVAGPDREGGAPGAAQGGVREPDRLDDAGEKRELEGSAGQILFRHPHAGGGVAPAEDPPGEAAEDQVQACGAYLPAFVRVEVGLGEPEGFTRAAAGGLGAEAGRTGLRPFQDQAGDGEAGGLGGKGEAILFSRGLGLLEPDVGRLLPPLPLLGLLLGAAAVRLGLPGGELGGQEGAGKDKEQHLRKGGA